MIRYPRNFTLKISDEAFIRLNEVSTLCSSTLAETARLALSVGLLELSRYYDVASPSGHINLSSSVLESVILDKEFLC
ncbi:hypothetical protein [Tortoise microvirus 67]|nr:hypothetical protein [Tortoise microvirus 67]